MEKEFEKLKYSIIFCSFVLAITLYGIGHGIEKAADATKAQTLAIEAQTNTIRSSTLIGQDSSRVLCKTIEVGAAGIKGAIDALNSTIHNK